MSEQAPEKLLEAGGEHELQSGRVELAPTSQVELAHEQQKLDDSAEAARTEASITASESNPIERFQADQAASEPAAPQVMTKETKQQATRQQLKRVQRQESTPNRTLSKVIHQPAVRTVSEAAGKTVSRPSGLLGGGLLAFVGSALYLYFTKYIGVPYNYFIFILLLVGGFVLGLVLEFLVWTLTASRRRAD